MSSGQGVGTGSPVIESFDLNIWFVVKPQVRTNPRVAWNSSSAVPQIPLLALPKGYQPDGNPCQTLHCPIQSDDNHHHHNPCPDLERTQCQWQVDVMITFEGSLEPVTDSRVKFQLQIWIQLRCRRGVLRRRRLRLRAAATLGLFCKNQFF